MITLSVVFASLSHVLLSSLSEQTPSPRARPKSSRPWCRYCSCYFSLSFFRALLSLSSSLAFLIFSLSVVFVPLTFSVISLSTDPVRPEHDQRAQGLGAPSCGPGAIQPAGLAHLQGDSGGYWPRSVSLLCVCVLVSERVCVCVCVGACAIISACFSQVLSVHACVSPSWRVGIAQPAQPAGSLSRVLLCCFVSPILVVNLCVPCARRNGTSAAHPALAHQPTQARRQAVGKAREAAHTLIGRLPEVVPCLSDCLVLPDTALSALDHSDLCVFSKGLYSSYVCSQTTFNFFRVCVLKS